MGAYLVVRFSNENGVVEAETGWSSDGRAFSDPSATAHAILPGAPAHLVDTTMRQLVASLCATLPEQAADDEQFVRDQAEAFLRYLADAVHSEREIVYTLDADSGQLPSLVRR